MKGTGFSFNKNNASELQQEQQAFFKPFKFIEPTEKLNILLVDNLDVERIYHTGDIVSAQTCLKNFVSSKFSRVDVETMKYEQYYKLFRLSQLAMEYYSHQQQVKQKQADDLYVKFKEVQDRSNKLEELKNNHQSQMEQIKNKIDSYKRQIEDLKEQTAQVGKFKCIYCNKQFQQKDALNAHVKKRHQDLLEEIKATNQLFQEENPIMKIKKLEEERRNMAEQLNLKYLQQFQKIEETKINEEKLVSKLSEKLQKEINKNVNQAFSDNSLREKEQENINRDTQNKKVMLDNITKMQSMFNGFENMFKDFEKKQSEMSSNQLSYKEDFNKIKDKQQEFIKQNQENERKLQEEKKKAERKFEDIKIQNIQSMSKDYINNLSEAVSEDKFLQQTNVINAKEGLKKKDVEQQEQNLRSKQYPNPFESNVKQFGELEDDEQQIEEDDENDNIFLQKNINLQQRNKRPVLDALQDSQDQSQSQDYNENKQSPSNQFQTRQQQQLQLLQKQEIDQLNGSQNIDESVENYKEDSDFEQ